jgi:hypothetical protein
MKQITLNTNNETSLQPIILNYKSQIDVEMSLLTDSQPLTSIVGGQFYFAIDNDYNFDTPPIYEALSGSFSTTELSAGQLSMHLDLDTPSLSAFIGEADTRRALCCLWHTTSAENTLLLHTNVQILNISVDK